MKKQMLHLMARMGLPPSWPAQCIVPAHKAVLDFIPYSSFNTIFLRL